MELLNEIKNNLNIGIDSSVQSNFLNSTFGKVINGAVDTGLRFILPDFIEDDIIDVKDALIKGGLSDGINTAVNKVLDVGKSALGIITGNFESVSQIKRAVEKGGIIESISGLIDNVVNVASGSGFLSKNIENAIKTGKNFILNNVSNDLENTFKEQIKGIEQIEEYSKNWYDCYNNRDFNGMEREYSKLNKQLDKVVPLEKIIVDARKIETMHNFIKNNDMNFDVTVEQLRAISNLN